MQTLLKVTLEVIDTEHLEELLHKDDDGDGSKTKETSNSMTPSQKPSLPTLNLREHPSCGPRAGHVPSGVRIIPLSFSLS